jgi:hypothetical protein
MAANSAKYKALILCAISIALCILVPATSRAQFDFTVSSVNGHDSSFATSIHDLPNENPKLTAEQINRLRVEWSLPKRSEITLGKGPEYRVPNLEVTGKITLLSEDGKTQKAVDWPLPISVVLARFPDQKPDWTRRHDEADAVWSEVLVGRNFIMSSPPSGHTNYPPGTIKASLPLSKLQTEPGKTRVFQLGISLGERNAKRVTWRNNTSILPQSVVMVKVDGPKPISDALRLINTAPDPMGWDYDPVLITRAVNGLRPLGKEKVIASLREFLDMAYDAGYFRNDIVPENMDSSNQYCLETLLPVLFPNVKFQTIDVEVFRGIPFHRVSYGGTTGSPVSTKPLVDQAQKEGERLTTELRPDDDPFSAADAFYAKIETKDDAQWDRPVRRHLRLQAWRLVKHLISDQGEYGPDLRSDAKWASMKAEAAKLKIHWDREKQEYVAGEKVR